MLPAKVCGYNETPPHYKVEGLNLVQVRLSLGQRKVNQEDSNFHFKHW